MTFGGFESGSANLAQRQKDFRSNSNTMGGALVNNVKERCRLAAASSVCVTRPNIIVVYFDQGLGAAHSKRWLK